MYLMECYRLLVGTPEGAYKCLVLNKREELLGIYKYIYHIDNRPLYEGVQLHSLSITKELLLEMLFTNYSRRL